MAVGPAHYIRHLEAAAIKRLAPEGNTKLENTFENAPLKPVQNWQEENEQKRRSRPWPRFRSKKNQSGPLPPSITQTALHNMQNEKWG